MSWELLADSPELNFGFLCSVVLENLWRFSLTNSTESLGLRWGLICWRGPGWFRFQTLKGTTIAFINCALGHPKRFYSWAHFSHFGSLSAKVPHFFASQEVELYKLGPPETFHYLNQSSCMEIPGKDSNADEYLKTKRAMSIVGVSPEEQVGVLGSLSSLYPRFCWCEYGNSILVIRKPYFASWLQFCIWEMWLLPLTANQTPLKLQMKRPCFTWTPLQSF